MPGLSVVDVNVANHGASAVAGRWRRLCREVVINAPSHRCVWTIPNSAPSVTVCPRETERRVREARDQAEEEIRETRRRLQDETEVGPSDVSRPAAGQWTVPAAAGDD